MISKGKTRTNVVASNLVLGLCIINLSACFLAGDEHNAEVERLMQLDRQELSNQISRMPDKSKVSLLVSSWKRHPPSNLLNEDLKHEDLEFTKELTARVNARDGYVVTVEMLDFLLEMQAAGSLSRSDIQSLQLQDICSKNAPGESMCTERLKKLLR